MSNPFESIEMVDNRSAAQSVSYPPPLPPHASLISLLVFFPSGTLALLTDPGLLLPSSSLLLIPNADLSGMGRERNEEGSGWQVCGASEYILFFRDMGRGAAIDVCIQG